MKPLEFFMPLLALALIFSVQPAYAAPTTPAPIVVNIDLTGVIDAINNSTSSNSSAQNTNSRLLNNTLGGLKLDFYSLFTNSAKAAIWGFNKMMLDFTFELLSTTPDTDSMHSGWEAVTLIISSLYTLVFTFAGMKFLLSGEKIEERQKAKEWLKNAFMMIIGVNASFALYNIILELAAALTKFFWIAGFEGLFSDSAFSSAGLLLLVLSIGTNGFALMTLFLRHVFLLVAVMLFPIGIFLYYTPKLQRWGRIIFNLIGIALFMQFVDVMVFVAANQMMVALIGEPAQVFVPALSFALVGTINVLMVAYALFNSAFGKEENAQTHPRISFDRLPTQIGELNGTLKELQNSWSNTR